jgi:hypothetical protein
VVDSCSTAGVWLVVVVVMMRRARDVAPVLGCLAWVLGGLNASFGNAGAAAARRTRRYRSANPSLAFLSLFAHDLEQNLPISRQSAPSVRLSPAIPTAAFDHCKTHPAPSAHIARSLLLLPFAPSSHRGVPIRSQPLHDAFASTRSIA